MKESKIIWPALAGVVGAIYLVGCAGSSSRLGKLSPGMSRPEVFRALGRPHSVAAHGTVEYLTYNLLNKGAGDLRGYSVKLNNGRVEAFGERSDFGPNLLATNPPVGL